MKTFSLLSLLIIIISSCFSQNTEIIGVINTSEIDPDFDKGHFEIKQSIKESLFNLNLYEYSHAMNELYELIHNKEITIYDWNNYIDSLIFDITNQNQLSHPTYALDYKGIIPLQAEFFIKSLEINVELKKMYPNEHSLLKESSSKLLNIGYKNHEIDSLLVFFPVNSTVGTVNFWYFLQVLGCPIVKIAINRIGLENTELLLSSLNIVSTYKTPYVLQKRKIQSLQRNLNNCIINGISNPSDLIGKRKIAIYDKKKDYFEKALEEGFDLQKNKEF